MAKISLGEFGYRTPGVVQVDQPSVGEALARAGGEAADVAAATIARTNARAEAEAEAKRREGRRVESLTIESQALNELAAARKGIIRGLQEGTIHRDQAFNVWKEQAPKIITDKLGSASEENRALIKASLIGPIGVMGMEIEDAADARFRQDVGAGMDGYLEGLERFATEDLDYSVRNAESAIDSYGPLAGLTTEQIAGKKQSFRERAAINALNEYIVLNRDNVPALQRAQALASKSNYLTPEARNQFYATIQSYMDGAERRIEAQRRQAEAEAQKQNAIIASDLEISVRRGQAGYREIENAFRESVITPAKRTELVVYLDEKLKKEADKAAKQREQISRVESALSGSLSLDFRSETDRDAVDAYFTAVIGPSLQKLAAPEAAARIADFSGRVGIIPRPVREQIRGALRAGLPAVRAEAADLLDRLKASNPGVVDDFSAEDIALGNAIANYVNAGVAPQQAVTIAEEAIKVPEPAKDAREVRYRAEKASEKNRQRLAKELGSGFNVFGPSMPEKIPDAMAGEFETLVKNEFIRGGDLDIAQKTALDHLKGVWGMTEIGGRRWMKYAPEVVYRVQGEDPAWIGEQLYEELSKDALWQGKPDLLLQDDSITGRESKPSYVVLMRKDGALEPVLGKDRRPLRFRPDYASSPAGRRRMQQVKEEAHEQYQKATKRYLDALKDPGSTSEDLEKLKTESDLLHSRWESLMKAGEESIDDATRGELGVLKRPDGGQSTEISITVTDKRLNEGKPTNIPLLVRGQKNVDALLRGEKWTREQEEHAITRAAERVKAGASLPSYGSIEEAEVAARARSKSKDTKEGFEKTAPY